MNVLELLVSSIASHNCVVCDAEGGLLCQACLNSSLPVALSRCYRCHKITSNQAVCQGCKRLTGIGHMWISTDYGDIAKKLIHSFKFERAIDAARPIAEKIDQNVPNLPKNTLVCHVPTVNSRVRRRGYDQAEEIAKNFVRIRGYDRKSLLTRAGKTRQVGSGREDRFKQLESAFSVKKRKDVAGADILLIDDITTTGATMESAARALKKSGAKSINAAVFAQPV